MVHKLVSQLNSLTQKADLHALGEALRENPLNYDEIKSMCVFGDTCYKRNRIAGNEWYELLLICWKGGQSSRIHDHIGSNCAFSVVKGIVTEHQYKALDSTHAKAIGKASYETGSICLAYDGDIHRVCNEQKEDLVTLHVYSPPLNMVYYEEG